MIRKLASTDRNGHYEALRFIDSAGSWSADSKRLAFVTFEKGDNYLGIVDVDSRNFQSVRVPGIDAITNVAWSPDNRTIVLAGQATGVSDLFLFDTESKEVRRLTNDKYADMQPAFSPDGKTIAFVSDRGSGPEANLESLYFEGTRISTIDVASGSIKNLPLFAEREEHQSRVRAGRQHLLHRQSRRDGRHLPLLAGRPRQPHHARADRRFRHHRAGAGAFRRHAHRRHRLLALRGRQLQHLQAPGEPALARRGDDEYRAVERARRPASAAARHRLDDHRVSAET